MDALETLLLVGETNYITKHNNNYSKIKNAVDTLEGDVLSLSEQLAGAGADAFNLLFGFNTGVFKDTSYVPVASGSTLTVSSGYAWRPDLQQVVGKVDSTDISFSGQGSNTYYIDIGNDGVPVRSTALGVASVYSLLWNGSSFSAITRLFPVIWAQADWAQAQTSTALSTTFGALGARLDAIEALLSGGTAQQPYVLSPSYYTGTIIPPSARLPRHRFPVEVTFPANFAGSSGYAEGGATASAIFSIVRNSSQVGTATFSGTSATFASSGGAEVTFAIGDTLQLVAPASSDATLSDVAFTLLGYR